MILFIVMTLCPTPGRLLQILTLVLQIEDRVILFMIKPIWLLMVGILSMPLKAMLSPVLPHIA